MRSTTSSRVMPMPLSRMVSVRGVLVDVDVDVQIRGVDVEVLVAERLEPQFVQRVGGVGYQLPQERILVGVDGMDHQLQQLTGLRLKFSVLNLLAHAAILRPAGNAH